ncbi:unnamed protein product [Amoebophrya sp. A25]|nr:unnamed protein product [Amoebophrya sp. A25]|eukprot:GSA25T00017916001.1
MMIDDIWVTFRLASLPRKFLLPEDETLEETLVNIQRAFDARFLNLGLMDHAKKEKLERLPPPLDRLPKRSNLSPQAFLDQQERHDTNKFQQKNLIHFIYPYDLSGSGKQVLLVPNYVYTRNLILGERASRYVMDSAVVGTSMCDRLGAFDPHILGFEAKVYDISSSSTMNKGQVQEEDAATAPLDKSEKEAPQKSTTMQQEDAAMQQEDAAMQQRDMAVYPPFHHFVGGVRNDSDSKCPVIFPQWRPFAHMLSSAKNWSQFADTEVCCREAERCEWEHTKQIVRGAKELRRQTLSGVDEVAVVPYKVRRSPRST